MRLSRTGLILCAIYTLASVATWVYASTRTGDPKGTYVLMQLPVALAHAAAWKLGLLPLLEPLPDIVVWVLFFLPTLAVVYGAGWLAGRFFGTLTRRA